MKKNLFALFAIAALSVSCAEKINSDKQSSATVVATCSQADFQPGDAISVYRGSFAGTFNAKRIESSTCAEFEGKIAASATGRLSVVYPAVPVDDESPCAISIKEQKFGDKIEYAGASIANPVLSAPVSMNLEPMTSKGIVCITNNSDMQLKLNSISVSGGSMFYSNCNFSASATKNTYTDPVINVAAGEMALAIGQMIELPFYMFPGEVAAGRPSVTMNMKDDEGKEYRVTTRVDFSRPKAGAESKMSISLTTDMVNDTPQEYTIVYAKSLSANLVEGIKTIQSIIKSKTGLTVPCVSDDAAESEYEILFGETNRQASKDINCPDNAHVIKSSNKKLVVKGSSADQLTAALYSLERKVLSNTEYFYEGRIKLSSAIDIRKETGEILAMRHMIANLYDFTLKESLLKSFKGESTATVAQGACTDGTYGYYAFRNGAETLCIIYKYRLSDHSKVAQVTLDLTDCGGYCHVNDLVYEPESDIIYASAWSNTNGSPKCLLRVKASNMTQITSVSVPSHSPTALAYNPASKIFMSRSGANVFISDAGFTSSRKVNSSYEKYGYTNQGGGGDNLYCYFPVNNGTNSQLLTFDWSGKQLWNIQINNKIESESLFVVGEKYYWWCYGSSTGYLYLLTPVMKFTPGFKGGWSDIASPALN